MNILFGEKIRELRKSKGLSQEKLAEVFGVSVQAVSKWECSLSYPDTELLCQIADLLGVSIDYLLRDGAHASGQNICGELPDDDVLRVIQCRGRTVLKKDLYDPNVKIPLAIDRTLYAGNGCPDISVEIWGSAQIEGNISGGVNAGKGVNCGNVSGGVNAGNGINCGNISGGVNAGDGINCGNISGGANAGGGINCGDIDGDIMSCDGDIHCAKISGSVSCSGNIYYNK